MAQMPDIEGGPGPVEGFAHRVEHDAAGFMRHLMHHGAPQQPKTCGQCHDGVIRVDGCTCGDGLPPHGHEPGCGYEECPNGCWDILHPQPATQTPAVQPVNLAAALAAAEPPKENPMQISDIAGDIKGAVENADEWVRQVTETHLPSLLAQAQRYESSPIVQALESALLPPEVESGIAAMIKDLAARYPAPVVAAPDAPAAPVPAQ